MKIIVMIMLMSVSVYVPATMSMSCGPLKKAIYIEEDDSKWEVTAVTRVDDRVITYKLPQGADVVIYPKSQITFTDHRPWGGGGGAVDQETAFAAFYNYYNPSRRYYEFTVEMTIIKFPQPDEAYVSPESDDFYDFISSRGMGSEHKVTVEPCEINGKKAVYVYNELIGEKMELKLSNGMTLMQALIKSYYFPIDSKNYLCYRFEYNFYNSAEVNQRLDAIAEKMLRNFSY